MTDPRLGGLIALLAIFCMVWAIQVNNENNRKK